MSRPHLKFWGDRPPVPQGLRPCHRPWASIYIKPMMHIEYSTYFDHILMSPLFSLNLHVCLPNLLFCFLYFDHDAFGPCIKNVTLLTNFDTPSSVTLCHTSVSPLKYVTHLGLPQFLIGQKSPVQNLSQ